MDDADGGSADRIAALERQVATLQSVVVQLIDLVATLLPAAGGGHGRGAGGVRSAQATFAQGSVAWAAEKLKEELAGKPR